MSRSYISKEIREQVAEDAHYYCGYCLTQQKVIGSALEIEHLIPESKGGSSERENLWLACRSCNSRKGNQTEAIDPETNTLAPLFNPRTQIWPEHFQWNNDQTEIAGLTPIGRATVEALKLNNEYVIAARHQWVLVGWHPPRI